MIKFVSILIPGLLLVGCSSSTDYRGKYYSFSEAGDYNELWIGEKRALTYVVKIDQFFLYEFRESNDTLYFDLLESEILNDHRFALRIREIKENVLVASFIGESRIDTLKPYFVIDRGVPEIGPTLDDNAALVKEIRVREAAGGHSHEGHNH